MGAQPLRAQRLRRPTLGTEQPKQSDAGLPAPTGHGPQHPTVPVAEPAVTPFGRARSVGADVPLPCPVFVLFGQLLDPRHDLVYRGQHGKGGQPPLCGALLTGRQTVAGGLRLFPGPMTKSPGWRSPSPTGGCFPRASATMRWEHRTPAIYPGTLHQRGVSRSWPVCETVCKNAKQLAYTGGYWGSQVPGARPNTP